MRRGDKVGVWRPSQLVDGAWTGHDLVGCTFLEWIDKDQWLAKVILPSDKITLVRADDMHPDKIRRIGL